MAIDINEDLVPSDGSIKSINELVQRQLELEAELAELEEKTKKKTDELRQVQERELPDAMAAAGIEELKLENGSKLSINSDLKISVGKERMPGVCNWLRKHNHDDIIKRECVVSLPKGTDPKLVQRLTAGLTKLKVDFAVEENVHSQTLKALLKEQRAKGAEITLADFGAFPFRKAVIKLPKTNTGE